MRKSWCTILTSVCIPQERDSSSSRLNTQEKKWQVTEKIHKTKITIEIATRKLCCGSCTQMAKISVLSNIAITRTVNRPGKVILMFSDNFCLSPCVHTNGISPHVTICGQDLLSQGHFWIRHCQRRTTLWLSTSRVSLYSLAKLRNIWLVHQLPAKSFASFSIWHESLRGKQWVDFRWWYWIRNRLLKGQNRHQSTKERHSILCMNCKTQVHPAPAASRRRLRRQFLCHKIVGAPGTQILYLPAAFPIPVSWLQIHRKKQCFIISAIRSTAPLYRLHFLLWSLLPFAFCTR